ncbi:carbohydrate-binding protein [Cellulomonas sp. APG4]|uniref:glycoside hydrolase family 66 protein n=1 Tax=Cellulomonas sp. APG4 TaxID=1538656 RepID=UPI00137B8E2D|nr:glycoside hydrolase family 66 protein [Cellulomonas sp. APG4]NCT90458.1 carbohydrate-binding protein [Cellulomonas sp. APG4]
MRRKHRTGRAIAVATAVTAVGVATVTAPSAAAAADGEVDVVEAYVDLARYEPGQPAQVDAVLSDDDGWSGAVSFTLSHLGEVVQTGSVNASVPAGGTTTATWRVTPPSTDFTGYLVEVEAGGDATTTAIDVSSDWTVFPRMGYLHDYGPDVTAAERAEELDTLVRRYHLNALQFYDWMWRHEKPIERDAAGDPVSTWTAWNDDVIAPQTVQDYIADANQRGVAALPYTMSYAALEGFEAHGVDPAWRLQYADTGADWSFQMIQDRPDTVLHLMNPADPGWRDHITAEYLDQVTTMGFDGTHLDQLGNWGRSVPGGETDGGMQDVSGQRVDLPGAFAALVDTTAAVTSGTKGPVVGFNAVDGFGGEALAASRSDYLYTELWENHETYAQVQQYLDAQRDASGGKPAVVAAYVNNHSNTGLRAEAEDGVLGGDAAVDSDHAGFTGSGFVDQFGATGDEVTVTVTVPESRRYGLVARYANGTPQVAMRTVSVDGVEVGRWRLQSGSGWDDWRVDGGFAAYMEAGTHTVTVSVEPDDTGYINLDSITLGTFDTTSAKLANAAFAASGATHIEMGQGDQMLSAPYFLDHSKQMSVELAVWQKTYYDVITAYENVLFGPTLESSDNAVEVAGRPASDDGTGGTVWASAMRTSSHDVVHLVNLLGNSGTWREGPKNPIPTQTDVPVTYYLDDGVAPRAVRVASPDRDNGVSATLPFTVGKDAGGRFVSFTVPELDAWSFVYLDRSADTTSPGNVVGYAGKCLDAAGGSAADGTAVQLWDCAGVPAMQWDRDAGRLTVLGTCLDLEGGGTANGTLVHLWSCHTGASQQWEHTPDGQYRNPASGRCLDVVQGLSANGTRLHLWDCHGGVSQRWSLPF